LSFPARQGGDPSVVGGPRRQATHEQYLIGTTGGHTADPLWPWEIEAQMGLGFSYVVLLAPLHC